MNFYPNMEELKLKKRYLLIVLSVLAVAVATIGGTMASKTDDGVSITADISEKTLGVKANKSVIDAVAVMPGQEEVVKYTITNDGGLSNGTNSDNGSYDIYAKVDVYFDWTQDADIKSKYGEIDASANYLKLFIDTATNDEVEYQAIPGVSSYDQQKKIGDWIITYCADDQITMYYTKPLADNQMSSDFISKIAFDTAMDNKYAGAKLDISAEVSAVQANSADAAYATEWGVYPKFVKDGSGVLILDSVSENAE